MNLHEYQTESTVIKNQVRWGEQLPHGPGSGLCGLLGGEGCQWASARDGVCHGLGSGSWGWLWGGCGVLLPLPSSPVGVNLGVLLHVARAARPGACAVLNVEGRSRWGEGAASRWGEGAACSGA